ncbi:hotdog fold thioesterase [Actinacidiphila oryziradicis]|nr:hotdog fold thioesterase [Actinacidiphila oryziradicis]
MGSVDKLTIRAVAKEVGVAAPSIYLHFEDKAELVRAALSDKYDDLVARMAAADDAADGADPREPLRAQAQAYCRFALDNPGHYRLMFEVRQPRVEASRISGHLARHVSASVRAGFPRCQESGYVLSLPVAAHDRPGIEVLQAIIDGTLPGPPIARLMSFDLISVTAGSAVFELTPDEYHYNPIGSVHGGVYATLLDSAAGCAVHSLLPAGVRYTSLDLTVKFLRPVTTDTGQLLSTGTVTHLGKRTALTEAKLTDKDGRLLATAISSCLIIRD